MARGDRLGQCVKESRWLAPRVAGTPVERAHTDTPKVNLISIQMLVAASSTAVYSSTASQSTRGRAWYPRSRHLHFNLCCKSFLVQSFGSLNIGKNEYSVSACRLCGIRVADCIPGGTHYSYSSLHAFIASMLDSPPTSQRSLSLAAPPFLPLGINCRPQPLAPACDIALA